MSYFIEYIRTYANVNKKGMKLQEFVLQFGYFLIPDELSLDALKSELEAAIETMNAKYPRTMPVYLTHAGAGNHFQWYIQVKDRPYDYVCVISFKRVRGIYQYSLHPEEPAHNAPERHAQSAGK